MVIKVNSEKEMNQNEFLIMKHMSDKNISGFPKVYSQGLIQSQPYIVQEKLGLSIKDILKRLKLTINDTNEVEFFVELCEIPKFIHNISPKDIESFIIRRAMLDGEELLMNLKL